MKLTNVVGQVIADDGIDDGQTISSSIGVKQSRKMSKNEIFDLFEYVKGLMDDQTTSGDANGN